MLSLRPTERNDENYSSFRLELLALKWAVVEKFKEYLAASEGKYSFYHIYSLTTYILLQHIFSYITLHKLFYIFYHNILS